METIFKKIYKTTDYSKFHFYPYNRDIDRGHVENLKKSILRDNRMHLEEIIVVQKEDKFFIHDGQHRFIVCKELKLPVIFAINEKPTEISMIDSQIHLNWSLKDCLKYYCVKEFPEYLKFKSIMETQKIPFHAFFALLGTHKFENSKLFRQGNLKVPQKAESFARNSLDARESIVEKYGAGPEGGQKLYRRDFLLALYWFYKNYPECSNKLFNSLKDSFSKISAKATQEDYEKECIKLYNLVAGRKKGLTHPVDEAKKNGKNITNSD